MGIKLVSSTQKATNAFLHGHNYNPSTSPKMEGDQLSLSNFLGDTGGLFGKGLPLYSKSHPPTFKDLTLEVKSCTKTKSEKIHQLTLRSILSKIGS